MAYKVNAVGAKIGAVCGEHSGKTHRISTDDVFSSASDTPL